MIGGLLIAAAAGGGYTGLLYALHRREARRLAAHAAAVEASP